MRQIYGNSCCLETNQNIKFDHSLKRWCSVTESEASLPDDARYRFEKIRQARKTVATLLQDLLQFKLVAIFPYCKSLVPDLPQLQKHYALACVAGGKSFGGGATSASGDAAKTLAPREQILIRQLRKLRKHEQRHR